MKDNYTIEIKKAKNGYIVEESWNVKDGEFSHYKSEKSIFPDWNSTATFVNDLRLNFN